jgi:hypothetical protein
MKHRIRGRDGAIREVGDGYVLQDGEACTWSKLRSWIRGAGP